jgi:hypothetical protein
MNNRREFLQKIGASALMLQLANVTTAWSNTPGETETPYEGPVLRVAIMGLGGYASIVAKAMESCTRAKLVGLISGTPSR